MEQGEKQEGQKTVVAFVAGLLIGGLLVWVFAASPDSSDNPEEMNDNDDTEMLEEGEMNDDDMMEEDTDVTVTPSVTVISESASFSVDNQPAGVMVEVGVVDFPTEEGWVVVHEDLNGGLGNALGASRFSVSEGLTASQVRLLRGTEAGNTYHVVLYSENGDKVFDLATDRPLALNDNDMMMASFVAQ